MNVLIRLFSFGSSRVSRTRRGTNQIIVVPLLFLADENRIIRVAADGPSSITWTFWSSCWSGWHRIVLVRFYLFALVVNQDWLCWEFKSCSEWTALLRRSIFHQIWLYVQNRFQPFENPFLISGVAECATLSGYARRPPAELFFSKAFLIECFAPSDFQCYSCLKMRSLVY